MADVAKYTIFKTKWGYFGLAANEKGLLRTCLPCPTRKIAKSCLLNGNSPRFDKNLLKSLQDIIVAYFNGQTVKFDIPLGINLPRFTNKVLSACRKIPAGKTVSYSQLARMIGNAGAARAVGSALAKNPIPLIIPCHRVIHSDGKIGNFSAFGGTDTKKKLLALEKT